LQNNSGVHRIRQGTVKKGKIFFAEAVQIWYFVVSAVLQDFGN